MGLWENVQLVLAHPSHLHTKIKKRAWWIVDVRDGADADAYAILKQMQYSLPTNTLKAYLSVSLPL